LFAYQVYPFYNLFDEWSLIVVCQVISFFNWQYVALIIILWRLALSVSLSSSSSSASVTTSRWEPVNVHV